MSSNSAARKRSICLVTQQYGSVLSGIGIHARNVVADLRATGHAVHLVTPQSEAPADAAFPVTTVPPPRFGGSQARWFSLALSFGAALRRLQRDHRFDLVQFTDARESLFYSGRAPAIGHINDTYSARVESLAYYRARYADGPVRWAYYRLVHALERVALRRLPMVVANSRYTAQTISQAYGLSERQMRMCYKSIDAAAFAPVHALRRAASSHPPRVLFVGGNMQRKGLPALIAASPAIAARVPDVEFWVAGRDNAQPHMEALCVKAGTRERFTFFGLQTQAQLMERYAGADVFAMPSLTEALGIVFLEAMAAGVPVIGSAVGGIPEIIDDGVNGALVPAEAPDILADRIVLLLRDPALRARLAQAALHTVDQFSVANMMACTHALYDELLAR